jgi:ribosomal protein L16/L10AE
MTKRPLKSRMGKGIGVIKLWIAYIKKGSIFLEITSISKKLATIVFKKIKFHFPLKLNYLRFVIYFE